MILSKVLLSLLIFNQTQQKQEKPKENQSSNISDFSSNIITLSKDQILTFPKWRIALDAKTKTLKVEDPDNELSCKTIVSYDSEGNQAGGGLICYLKEK